MRVVKYPSKEELETLLERPTAENGEIQERVRQILDRVKSDGDSAIAELTEKIDGVKLTSTRIDSTAMDRAEELLSDELKSAILVAKDNIERFHTAQLHKDVVVETMPGVICYQKAKAIERVGLYIPGGSAPLFSTVLMLAVPASVAGCKEIVLCTPMQKNGQIAPEVLFCAKICGIDEVYAIGGAMAIGAMAYGTETIKKTDKIFGPGNRYVTIAKQMVSLFDTSIDMPAGPSEVMVVCDSSADAEFVASDLLSQAEHGGDSQSIVVTTSETLAESISTETDKQLKTLTRQEITERALENSRIIVVRSRDEIMEIVNQYAPEHLIVSLTDAEEFALEVRSAGSIFIGNYTPESAGDYASGTNHTLPTSGWARSVSGVNIDSFTKKITYQKIDKEGLRAIGNTIEVMAMGEGLSAHANAVTVRLNKIGR